MEKAFEKVEPFRLTPMMKIWLKEYRGFNRLSSNALEELKKEKSSTDAGRRNLLITALLGAEEKKQRLMQVLPKKKITMLESQISRSSGEM